LAQRRRLVFSNGGSYFAVTFRTGAVAKAILKVKYNQPLQRRLVICGYLGFSVWLDVSTSNGCNGE